MARADEYLALLDDPSAPPPAGSHPADPSLIALLVHMSCADGFVQEEEFEYFEKLLPDRDASEILEYVAETAATELDFAEMSRQLGSDEERRGAMRFAARMAWADRVLEMQEKLPLIRMASYFDFHEDEVEHALESVIGRPEGEVSPEAVVEAMIGMHWTGARLEERGLLSELKQVAPPDAMSVACLLVDGEERAGLYDQGMAAFFEEGAEFLRWNEVSTYSRLPLLGAALRVVTTDGRVLTVRDSRLKDVGTLMDRDYSAGEDEE